MNGEIIAAAIGLVGVFLSVSVAVGAGVIARAIEKHGKKPEQDNEEIAVNDLESRMAQLQSMKFALRPRIVGRKVVDR